MEFCKISKLLTSNFRNLSTQKIEFSPFVNSIFGPNGSGKSNLLEAIYYLANRKSFRKNAKFAQMLSMDGDTPEISFLAVLADNDFNSNFSISGKVTNDNQSWFIDNVPTKKRFRIESMFISPFDSYVFHTKSGFRRQWVDSALSSLDGNYKKILSKYLLSLRFRNTLLSKKPAKYKEQIQAIDLQLSEFSRDLTKFREKFIEDISSYCDQSFQKLFSEQHSLKIVLESEYGRLTSTEIYNALQKNLKKDEILGYTQKGVHLDDYVFHFDGLNSFEVCSLGQQKMSYLSLNFAYIELFRYNLQSYPIVLIDDISSELDETRWRRLISYLRGEKFQVFITTANEKFREELEKEENVNKIYITGGKIQ